MKAIAKASSQRSLQAFQEALKQYPNELSNDPIIKSHLNSLYDTMIEQNLCKIIEPFSRVQVSCCVDFGHPNQNDHFLGLTHC